MTLLRARNQSGPCCGSGVRTMKAAEKRRGFGYWYWIVFRYCENGHEMALRAGRTKVFGHARGPSLPPGGTYCHSCDGIIRF